MKPPEKLPRPDFVRYLNSEPLEPQDISPEELKEIAEKDEWKARLIFSAPARKCCRLVMTAAKSNSKVRRWLMALQTRDSPTYRNLLRSIGQEVPQVGKIINDLNPDPDTLFWAIASAKYVMEGEK